MTEAKDEMVTIPAGEYRELLDAQKFLNALQSAGVGSWDGYDFACEIYSGDGSE